MADLKDHGYLSQPQHIFSWSNTNVSSTFQCNAMVANAIVSKTWVNISEECNILDKKSFCPFKRSHTFGNRFRRHPNAFFCPWDKTEKMK